MTPIGDPGLRPKTFRVKVEYYDVTGEFVREDSGHSTEWTIEDIYTVAEDVLRSGRLPGIGEVDPGETVGYYVRLTVPLHPHNEPRLIDLVTWKVPNE